MAYVSTATTEMTDDDIATILTISRSNNTHLNVTGVLLYHRGRFIQVLEGPEEQVRAKFATISLDPRHRGIQIVVEKPIRERQFPEWTMGFRPIADGSAKELEGFEDFFRARTGRARIEHAENEAQQYLEWLREYWLAA